MSEEVAAKPITVCFPFVGDAIGGSHISALKLVQNLDPSAVRALVALHDPDGPVARMLKRENVRFATVPPCALLPARGWPDRREIGAFIRQALPVMRRFLHEHQVRIVHTNDGLIHLNWGLAARAANVKLVWHHRGDPSARGVNLLAPLLAHHVITVSRFARPRRPLLPMARKCSVIRSPFDHPETAASGEDARDALHRELACPPDTRVLAYFGIFDERKRPLAFVDIVHHFVKRHPDIPVMGCFFGREPARGGVRQEAVAQRAEALGISGNIRFMGFRVPPEPWLRAVDILVVPALNEPFGRTLVEAMLLGTPVVATDHGGNPEAIVDEETGFLVPPDDLEAFVDPISRLLLDPRLRERVARQAREVAVRTYGTDIHTRSVTSVYERILRTPLLRDRLDTASPA